MEAEKIIEWLKPERIQKLYTKHKNSFGVNRLLIIGAGRNGIDCALHCKHLVERRFGSNDKKVRYIGIGDGKMLDEADWEGTVFTADETVRIVPEEAIYPCLNAPEKMPDYIRSWFDEGLKNYSPAMPIYGLSKRQCGRVALFNCIKRLTKIISKCVSAFEGSDMSLEVIITGNLGDVFFGGMFIDLAYIVKALFVGAQYPVKINGYIFCPDTAELIEKESRELGNYYGNTIIAKNELDRFQYGKKHFSQRYSDSFEVSSDKPPFAVCFIAAAEKSYAYTMSVAAEKIVSRMEILFTKDDDAESILSYNMLSSDESHEFRYLSCGAAAVELPLGKILSYLSVKVFTLLNQQLNRNSVGQMRLGLYGSKVTPDAKYLAAKAGRIPEVEFDEQKNPAFSMKELKSDFEKPIHEIEKWLDETVELTRQGADMCVENIVSEIINECEASKADINRGPFYAVEIIKKCLSELRVAIAKEDFEVSDMEEQCQRSQNLMKGAYRKLRTAVVFAGKSMEQYIYEIKDYAEYNRRLRTGGIVLDFYKRIYGKLDEYYKTELSKATQPFELITMNRGSILEGINAENEDSCIAEAFPFSEITEKLDKIIGEQLTEDRFSIAFKDCDILKASDEEAGLARETVKVVGRMFDYLLGLNFSGMCEFFGVEYSVGDIIERCMRNSAVSAKVTDKTSVSRIVCPKETRQGDIAELRASYNGMSYIWNSSVLGREAAVTQVAGGVKLESFKGYELWENMRYAYVNDSLKKHGIHIFN